MSFIRISKEFTLEMSHALMNYKGKCESIHGHSYHLTVTVIGAIHVNETEPRHGMVMDFGELKIIVTDSIIDVFDHTLVLHHADGLSDALSDYPTRIVKTPYQPTCENLVADFAQRIQQRMKSSAKLHSLKLRETSTSYAEWLDSDNV